MTQSVAVSIPSTVVAGSIARGIRIVLFVSFTAVGAQLALRLPFTPVPVTFQTLFVVLAGLVLGPRDGFYAMASYLVIGLLGAPVFAGFGFGPAALIGPTGGYLMAFPAAALAAGGVSHAAPGRIGLISAALIGSALILSMGSIHLALVLRLPISTALALGAVPFAAGEVLKAALASVLAGRR